MLKVEEIVRGNGRGKNFSVLHPKDGHWQVNLRREDKEKVSFMNTRNGLLEFTKMPYRFEKSHAIFQRNVYMVPEDPGGNGYFSS